MRDFYFLEDQNNDHSQVIPVQQRTQLARRTKTISYLSFFVCLASHAGVNMIAMTIIIASKYFINSKILKEVVIISFIYRILRYCQVLLRFVITGYILPYDLYET